MQYIFENVGYFHCVGEVSALDGDVFKNSSSALDTVTVVELFCVRNC